MFKVKMIIVVAMLATFSLGARQEEGFNLVQTPHATVLVRSNLEGNRAPLGSEDLARHINDAHPAGIFQPTKTQQGFSTSLDLAMPVLSALFFRLLYTRSLTGNILLTPVKMGAVALMMLLRTRIEQQFFAPQFLHYKYFDSKKRAEPIHGQIAPNNQDGHNSNQPALNGHDDNNEQSGLVCTWRLVRDYCGSLAIGSLASLWQAIRDKYLVYYVIDAQKNGLMQLKQAELVGAPFGVRLFDVSSSLFFLMSAYAAHSQWRKPVKTLDAV